MKKSSRNWSEDEDKMLAKTILENSGPRKLKWEQVAEIMHNNIEGCQKTGKQCRERWHNHLAPELNNSSEWTKQENQTLFIKHSQCGNKWAKIATFLKGRTDNCVKNHFYSTLRRGMRKVNNFIHDQRKQKNSIKQFKSDVLTKILIVADGDPEQKLNAKNNAESLSKKIKQLLIQISLGEDQNTYNLQELDKIIQLIMEFNKNCKKRKGKKKGASQKVKQKEEQDQQQSQMSQQVSQSRRGQSISVVQPNYVNKPEKKQNILIKDNINFNEKQKDKLQKPKQKRLEKQKNQVPKVGEKNQQSMNPQKTVQKVKIMDCRNKQKGNNLKAEAKENQNKDKNENGNYSQDQNEQNDKDEVKSVDLVDAPIVEKHSIWKNEQNNLIKRGNSIQSSELNNLNNFTASFYMGGMGGMGGTANNEQPIFINSGFGLPFASPQQTIVSKEMFGESGVGIKKNEALMYFSAISGTEERNSFFKMDGQRGVLQGDQLLGSNELQQKHNTNNNTSFNQQDGFKFKRDANSPGIFSNSFVNVGGFTKSEIANAQKNFLSCSLNKDASNTKK